MREVREHGGLAYAKTLLARRESDGLKRLREMGRLDLSVEALVLQPRYAQRLTPQERVIARARLEQQGQERQP